MNFDNKTMFLCMLSGAEAGIAIRMALLARLAMANTINNPTTSNLLETGGTILMTAVMAYLSAKNIKAAIKSDKNQKEH